MLKIVPLAILALIVFWLLMRFWARGTQHHQMPRNKLAQQDPQGQKGSIRQLFAFQRHHCVCVLGLSGDTSCCRTVYRRCAGVREIEEGELDNREA